MNKMNIITIITLVISTILVSLFNTIDGIFDIVLFEIALTLAITFSMYYKRKSIKKLKTIYDIILIILLLTSTIIITMFIHSIITCFISISCSNNVNSNLELILITLLLTYTFIQIIDFKIEKKKISHILTWIVSSIVCMIYIRYQYDAGFIHNYMYQNQFEIERSYIYVTQNYSYLSILYSCLLIHYLINKKK